jgi:hypothetical protein
MDTTQGLRERELTVRVEASGSDRIWRLGRSVARFSTLFPNRGPARRAAAPATRSIETVFYGPTSACTPIRLIPATPAPSKVPTAARLVS